VKTRQPFIAVWVGLLLFLQRESVLELESLKSAWQIRRLPSSSFSATKPDYTKAKKNITTASVFTTILKFSLTTIRSREINQITEWIVRVCYVDINHTHRASFPCVGSSLHWLKKKLSVNGCNLSMVFPPFLFSAAIFCLCLCFVFLFSSSSLYFIQSVNNMKLLHTYIEPLHLLFHYKEWLTQIP